MKKLCVIFVLPLFLAIELSASPALVQSLKSAAFPGWGLTSVNQDVQSKAFYAAEGVLALTCASLFIGAQSASENAIDLASYSLTKDVSDYPEYALLKMESFISSSDYNEMLSVKARELYPNSVEKQEEYVLAKSIPDSLSWEFLSESDMSRFAYKRTDARKLREFAFYSISALA
ncbi:MAG: hypothetical protein PHW02_05820 [bacterium]|nr:hypothetical protein [bacterium]